MEMGEAKRRANRDFEAQSPEQRLGDAPVEEEYAAKMRAVMAAVDSFFNGDKRGSDRDVGFVLMVFPYGDKSGRCNYMSNGADRRDIIVLMKEMVARFEGHPELQGRA